MTRLKNGDSKYPYYEHQAVEWAFIRTGSDWVLTLDPTWTFTQDGHFKLVGRNRHTRLASKKMGNERNQAVLNHVFFWAWAICGEQGSVRLDDGSGVVTVHHDPLTRHQVGLPKFIGSGVSDDPDPQDVEDLDILGPDDVEESDTPEDLDTESEDDDVV